MDVFQVFYCKDICKRNYNEIVLLFNLELLDRFQAWETKTGLTYLLILIQAARPKTERQIWQWSTTKWHFQVWLDNTLNNNTIRCKKLATIVLGRKYVTRPFVRRKQISTSAEMLLYFSTHAYLFLPDKGWCYIFSTQNNCCKFLASYGVIIQSATQSFMKLLLAHSFAPNTYIKIS